MVKYKNMRMAIIAFTGISVGIIVGISSLNIIDIKERNNTPIMQSFTKTAINSTGVFLNSDQNQVTISFENNPTSFKITEDTDLIKIITNADFNRTERIPISIDEIKKGSIVYIIYKIIENRLVADRITLLL